MVDQLNAFASEVTRVAREVGTEGRLGGQAAVPGVAGTWKDLTDTVNVMAANLTEQVRGIVKVVTAVADGEPGAESHRQIQGRGRSPCRDHQQHDGDSRDICRSGDEVAREVGVEGRLGGQANVPGAAGTWKDLTGNVNLLAANLDYPGPRHRGSRDGGDQRRPYPLDPGEARGEVAELKDNINTMIGNLRLTTEHNTEQDWLKTNLAGFTNMLQGQRDLTMVGRLLLSELAPLVNAQLGAIYQMEETEAAAPQALVSLCR